MAYKIIEHFGTLKTPLRNIISLVDGEALTLDLIPEIIEADSNEHLDEPREGIRALLQTSRAIVEAKQFLRLEFDYILAMAIEADIDADMFGGLHDGWKDAPLLHSTKSYYPLLEICDSKWKTLQPDYQGGDDENIRHIRVISLECSFDILGSFPEGKWMDDGKLGR